MNNQYTCGSHKHNHNQTVIETIKSMTDTNTLMDLADFFKILSDSTRIKIINALFEKELSVCCIADVLSMEQSAVSHQLRVLRQNKLVKVRKEGTTKYYSLDDDHIKMIFEMGLSHILEDKDE